MPDEYRIGRHRGRFSLVYNEAARGRVRIALGTDDRGLAESRARDIWNQLHAAPSERVADLWEAYVRDRKASVKRTDRFESTWKPLAPHFGHRLGPAIAPEDCRAYHRARKREGMADSTVRTELEFLRACLRFRYGHSAPKLWLPPSSAPRARYLTREELRTLLDHVETPHVKLFIILAVATGARMTAILELTWDRVDLKRGTVDYQPAGRHQTNKRRTVVPLNQPALTAMIEARRGALSDHVIEFAGGPIRSVKKAVASAAVRSGVPASPHVFRHTAGVWMAEADVPMQKIAQFLGHTSTRMVERTYARYSPSFMKDASAALTW